MILVSSFIIDQICNLAIGWHIDLCLVICNEQCIFFNILLKRLIRYWAMKVLFQNSHFCPLYQRDSFLVVQNWNSLVGKIWIPTNEIWVHGATVYSDCFICKFHFSYAEARWYQYVFKLEHKFVKSWLINNHFNQSENSFNFHIPSS